MTTRTARTPVTVPTVTRGCGSPARTVHTAERARAAAQGVGAPVFIARAMRNFGGHSRCSLHSGRSFHRPIESL